MRDPITREEYRRAVDAVSFSEDFQARTAALLVGRDYVLPDEVRDLARVVLPHRLVLESRSRYSGVTTAEIVEEILGKIKIPR